MVNGRHYVIQGRRHIEKEELAYMIRNMPFNKAYRYTVEQTGSDLEGRLLADFQARYRQYRSNWRSNPKYAIEHKLHHSSFRNKGFLPLCVDIETASICDLACPFCFRQWIATPDRLITDELCYRIIDEAKELNVPSVKFNWRGEALLHPRLPRFIDYAKRRGILHTILNTNAVTLDEKKSYELIESGLDLLIYSFEGGTKETYEKMRVGRFRENKFEAVYENIRRFARIRERLGAKFPVTKIQMVLTEGTFSEQDSFFELFSDCVDDVSVKPYTERGGTLPDLDGNLRHKLGNFLQERKLTENTAYWRDLHGNLYLAAGRLPCEQPFQRIMVSCEGRVSMCCYDWGIEYPIGYVDAEGFDNGNHNYGIVLEKARSKKKGFEGFNNVRMPEPYVEPHKKVETLKQIWYGDIAENARQMHVEGHIENVPICRRCPFKETYHWVKVDFENAEKED